MNKSILIIDTPKKCIDCPCCSKAGSFVSCGNMLLTYDNVFVSRSPLCPLKPLPEKKPLMDFTVSPVIDVQYSEYNKGYNDCLDKILEESYE